MYDEDMMQDYWCRFSKLYVNSIFSQDFTSCLCFPADVWILIFISFQYSEAFFEFQPVSGWIQYELWWTKFMLIYEKWYVKECVKEIPKREDRMWVHNLDDLT